MIVPIAMFTGLNCTNSLITILVASIEYDDRELEHAVVLDSYRDGCFLFKNTVSTEKTVIRTVDHPLAPDKFYFVRINVQYATLIKRNQVKQRNNRRRSKSTKRRLTSELVPNF